MVSLRVHLVPEHHPAEQETKFQVARRDPILLLNDLSPRQVPSLTGTMTQNHLIETRHLHLQSPLQYEMSVS